MRKSEMEIFATDVGMNVWFCILMMLLLLVILLSIQLLTQIRIIRTSFEDMDYT